MAGAAEVGLFEGLADRPATPVELARELSLDARAVGIVLGTLEALGLVVRESGRFTLTLEGRARYADPAADGYEGVAARRWRRTMRAWLQLDRALQEGGPLSEGSQEEDEEDEEESLARFMAAMAQKPSARVNRLVDLCLERRPDARTVLDLGGGPGVHSRAFAGRGLQATLFDRPEAIEHVHSAYGLEDLSAIELAGGDFLEELPEGPFDIVLLSNITHIYSAETNADLVRRIAGVQEPGSLIALMDFVRGRSAFAPLFAITMLLHTEEGDTHDLDAYRSWLSDAGYGQVEIEDVDEDRQLVTALLGR